MSNVFTVVLYVYDLFIYFAIPGYLNLLRAHVKYSIIDNTRVYVENYRKVYVCTLAKRQLYFSKLACISIRNNGTK